MKRLNELYKKYEGLIKLLVMFTPLVYGTFEYLKNYIDVPDRMNAFEERAKKDSIFVMKLFRNQDSINNSQNYWIYKYYNEIDSLKQQLNPKTP